jgi:catechol 2,3-dioxygenase-like lactoylglutathione lyase family enzyme
MNHFTILTDDVDATTSFYGDLLGLTPGWRPTLNFPGVWLYASDQPILHVIGGRPPAELKAGVIDHMAFTANGLADDDRKARGTQVAVRLPAPAGPRHVAALFPRPERCARRDGLRERRNAMTEVRRSNPPPAQLDHLILAATTLADGIEFVAGVTGATPHPGGKHLPMGHAQRPSASG